MKPGENRRTCNVSVTSGNGSWCHFHTQTNHNKQFPELTLKIHHLKPRQKNSLNRIDTQENKSPNDKNESNPGPQGVPLCVPVDPWLTNMVTQSAKIKSPRYQNGASRPPRLKFGINKIIHVSNQPVSSYLFTQGTGQQGRILMIYVYDSPTPHTASPPRPAPSPQQQKM
jgi:hypothetical protein